MTKLIFEENHVPHKDGLWLLREKTIPFHFFPLRVKEGKFYEYGIFLENESDLSDWCSLSNYEICFLGSL